MSVNGCNLLVTVTVGVNRFGRIGRCTLAHITESGSNDIEVVKLNATGSITTSAHLLRYDSIHGRFHLGITVNANSIALGRRPIDVMSTYDHSKLDWSDCDVVLEDTVRIKYGRDIDGNINNGANAEQIVATNKNSNKTIVYIVNNKHIVQSDTII